MITSLVYAAFFGYNGDHKFQISLLMKIAFAVLYVHARSSIGLHKITLIFLQVIHCSLKLRICHPPPSFCYKDIGFFSCFTVVLFAIERFLLYQFCCFMIGLFAAECCICSSSIQSICILCLFHA
jgi:hypothetical protein